MSKPGAVLFFLNTGLVYVCSALGNHDINLLQDKGFGAMFTKNNAAAITINTFDIKERTSVESFFVFVEVLCPCNSVFPSASPAFKEVFFSDTVPVELKNVFPPPSDNFIGNFLSLFEL